VHRPDPRPGIAVENELAQVQQGALFSRPYRRFAPAALGTNRAAGVTAWMKLCDDLGEHTVEGIFGGDRGRAALHFSALPQRPLAGLCEEIQHAAENAPPASSGLLLYLLTPCTTPLAEIQWRGSRPIAAALGRPVWISGWDVGRHCPRPMCALLPPGSVLCFEWPPGGDRAEAISGAWLESLDTKVGYCGFGRVLAGVWSR
jgi:CRISPR-associated protein Cmr3